MEDDLAIDSILESANLLWEKGDFERALEVLKAAYRGSPSNVGIAFEYGATGRYQRRSAWYP